MQAVAFSPRGDFFASGGEDNMALVWKWFDDNDEVPPPPPAASSRQSQRRQPPAHFHQQQQPQPQIRGREVRGRPAQHERPAAAAPVGDDSFDGSSDGGAMEAQDAEIHAAVSSATFVDPFDDTAGGNDNVSAEPEYVRTSPRHRAIVAEADDAEELEDQVEDSEVEEVSEEEDDDDLGAAHEVCWMRFATLDACGA